MLYMHHVSLYIYIYMYICVLVYVYVCLHVYTCMCIRIFPYVLSAPSQLVIHTSWEGLGMEGVEGCQRLPTEMA